MDVGHHMIIFFLLAIQGAVAIQSNYDDSEPSFAEAIPNITVVEGSDVTIPCVVDSLGKYKVAWIQSDSNNILTIKYHRIWHDSRFGVTSSNNRIWSLKISNVDELDTGHYMCQINTSPMKSSVGFLQVVVPPTIQIENQLVGAAIGADATLVCNVYAIPRSATFWKRKSDGLLIHSRYNSSKYDSIFLDPGFSRVVMMLVIKDLRPDDFDTYTCFVNNSKGEAEGTIKLYEIPEPHASTYPSTYDGLEGNTDKISPKIRTPNPRLGAAIGGEITLICYLKSNPKAVTYWSREGGGFIIIPNTKYNIISSDTDINRVQMTLIIKNVGPDDFGSYRCVAKNSVGEAEGNITVYDITESYSSTTPSTDGLTSSSNKISPKIRIRNRRVRATIGADVTLVCNLKSNPKSVTYWSRDAGGSMVISDTKYSSTIIDKGINRVQMRLLIKNVGPGDFGSYRCVAKNSVGNAERTIKLYESPEPHSSMYPATEGAASSTAQISPKIRIPKRQVGAAIGADVTLVCNLKSNPKSLTYWSSDGGGLMVISDTKYSSILIDKGTNKVQLRLLIKNVGPDDFGSYRCIAKNLLGEAEGNIKLYEIPESLYSTYSTSKDLAKSAAESKMMVRSP